MTSHHPWLATVLPGEFQAGGNSSGYWVFFALVLLVDAITVIAVALSELLPALREMVIADPSLMLMRLGDRKDISDEARSGVLDEMGEELAAARTQLFIGRALLIAGMLFLIMAFGSVTLSFARALPAGSMFVRECVHTSAVCAPEAREVANAAVRFGDIRRFTLDQISRAALFGAPEVYDWHIGDLASNPHNGLFSHFVFAFRLLFGLILILTLVSLRTPSAAVHPERAPSLKSVPLAETQEISA